MILVDSSAWIDFLHAGPRAPAFSRVQEVLETTREGVTCGPVLQEVIQGIQDHRQLEEVRRLLMRLPYLETTREVYVRAAELHRLARRSGRRVSSGDAVIAAVAIQHHAALMSGDKDFMVFQRQADLRLLPV